MELSRHIEIPFYSGIGRQHGRGFGALAQVFGRAAIPFWRKHIVPATKREGAGWLEFALPEIAEVVSGRKCFKTAPQNVRRQTLRKPLGSGSREEIANRVQITKCCSKKIFKTNQSVAERDFHKHFSLIISNIFRYHTFVAVSGNLGGKVPVVDNVSASHELERYPTTPHDENCIEFDFQTDRNYYVDSG